MRQIEMRWVQQAKDEMSEAFERAPEGAYDPDEPRSTSLWFIENDIDPLGFEEFMRKVEVTRLMANEMYGDGTGSSFAYMLVFIVATLMERERHESADSA